MNQAQQTALVLIPGTVNHFYNQTGRRVAEALRANGWQVELATLATAPARAFEWVFLINAVELVYSCGQVEGRRQLAALRQHCRRLVHVLIDCVTTRWFAAECELGAEIGIDWICDLGLHDQAAQLAAAWRPYYQFVFNGLTPTELAQLQTELDNAAQRPLPWAVIGHQTEARVQLVKRLLREFDPRGFCYLPDLEAFTETGAHLNEEQIERVLRRSRLYVWASHHQDFYLESERFRGALLAGALPVKVLLRAAKWRPPAAGTFPFDYLLFDEEDFTTQLHRLELASLQRRFIDDCCQLPTLAQSLQAACELRG